MLRVIRRIYQVWSTAGIAEVYSRVRLKMAARNFRPYEHDLNVLGNTFHLSIEDFEASIWYGKYRYAHIVWPQIEFDWMAQHTESDEIIVDGVNRPGKVGDSNP